MHLVGGRRREDDADALDVVEYAEMLVHVDARNAAVS